MYEPSVIIIGAAGESAGLFVVKASDHAVGANRTNTVDGRRRLGYVHGPS